MKPILLMVAASSIWLTFGCSRDDGPTGSSQGPSSIAPGGAPGPTPAAEIEVSPPRPLALVPLADAPESWPINRRIWGVLVYDSVTGETIVAAEARDGSFWLAWLSETELLVRLRNQVAIYDAAAHSYQAVQGIDLEPNSNAVPSPDGRWVAIGRDDRNLLIADLSSRTLRELSTTARPDSWSPDSTLLLIDEPEGGEHSVLQLGSLDTPIRMPDAGYYSGWVNEYQLLANAHILVDVRAPEREQALTGVERGHFSPDGTYIAASHIIEDSPDPRLRRFGTAVYRLEPFAKIAEFEDIALCCTQDRNIWSSDSSHFVALQDLCREDESLVMVDITHGTVTELARGGTSQVAVSPDDASVAFAHQGTVAIVPADASGPLRRITPNPLGYPAADLDWSRDGRFLAFTIGGYDRCP